MQNKGQEKIEKINRRKQLIRKWRAPFGILCGLILVTTLYLLNKPAIATTTETASSEVGASVSDEITKSGETGQIVEVVEDEKDDSSSKGSSVENAGDESGSTEKDAENEEDQKETSDDSTNSENKDDDQDDLETTTMTVSFSQVVKKTVPFANDIFKLTASFVDGDDKQVQEESTLAYDELLKSSDEIEIAKAADEIDGYVFKKALVDDTEIDAIKKVVEELPLETEEETVTLERTVEVPEGTSEEDAIAQAKKEAAEELAKEDKETTGEKITYYFVTADGEEIEIDSDLSISLVYEKNTDLTAVTLTATLYDEFDEQLGEKYTEMDLPTFDEDNVLILNSDELPPYKNVKVKKTKGFGSLVYDYVKTVDADGKTIQSIKREEVAASDEDDADAESLETEKADAKSSKDKVAYAYSYTLDGESWINFEEDTDLKVIYKDSTKDEYVFEDDNVKVTATLQEKGAVPSDAELVVTQVEEGDEENNYSAYMDALNENAEAIAEESGADTASTYDASNTLMYDISFKVGEQEYEPTEGSVAVKFEFKKKQLTEEFDADDSDYIRVAHLTINDSIKDIDEEGALFIENKEIHSKDVDIELLTKANISLGTIDYSEFNVESFSKFIFINGGEEYSNPTAGEKINNIASLVGSGYNYGMVATSITLNNHVDSNFIASKIIVNDNQDGTAGRDTNGNNPGYFKIGAYEGDASYQINVNSLNSIYSDENKALILYCPNEIFNGTNPEGSNGKIWFGGSFSTKLAQTAVTEQSVKQEVNAILYSTADSLHQKVYSDNTKIYSIKGNIRDVIDLTAATDDPSDDSTYYIDGNSILEHNFEKEWILKKYKNQKVVFVYEGTSSKTISGYKILVLDENGNNVRSGVGTSDSDAREINVMNEGTDPDVRNIAETTIHYFPGAEQEDGTKVGPEISTINSLAGTVVAPYSKFTTGGAADGGWLLAKEIVINKEWHFLSEHTPPTSTVGASLNALKLIDGKVISVDNNNESFSEQFSFNLDQYNDGKWETVGTAKNYDSFVGFADRSFTNGGKYYFRIYENIPNNTNINGNVVTYDTRCYLIVYDITADAIGSTTIADGYPVKYVFDDSEKANEAVVNGDYAVQGTLVDGDTAFTFNNTTTETKIRVVKRFFDNSGADKTEDLGKTESVRVQITYKKSTDSEYVPYKLTSANVNSDFIVNDENGYGNIIELTSKNDFDITIKSLPLKDDNGIYYNYVITEVDNSNAWNVSYSGTVLEDGTSLSDYNDYLHVGIDGKPAGFYSVAFNDNKSSGEVAILNQSVASGVLPSTGSVGTDRFYQFGMLLMLLAAGFATVGCVKKYRRN